MTTPIRPRVFRRTGGHLHSRIQPVVLEYRSTERRSSADRYSDRDEDERYSDDLEDFQRAEKDLVRAARRATRAVYRGIDTYDEERRESAQAKKDGAVEDFPHNYAKAVSETLREGADVPLDLAEALAPKDHRKRVRRNLKRVSRTLRLFRL
jgi:hypothetical protein